jgi:hypothetical protein
MTRKTDDNATDDLSIHETISAALATEDDVSDVDVVESPEQVSNRDEHGRFKAKGEAAAEKAPADVAEASADGTEQPASTWTQDKPPSSWTPAAREKWNEIPPELRQEIIRREEASVMGVRKMQESIAPAKEFLDSMNPYVQEAQSLGVDFRQHVSSVLNTERVLRTADMPSKFNALLGIADQYGIPLRDIVNQSVGQQVLEAPHQQQAAIPPEFQREMQEIRQWRDQMETAQVEQAIHGFSADKEFYGDVRHQMADLIEKGLAPDLNAAYDQACWMNAGVREVLLARQSSGQQNNVVAKKQVAAASTSIKPGGKVSVKVEDESDNIADIVRGAFAAGSGRI